MDRCPDAPHGADPLRTDAREPRAPLPRCPAHMRHALLLPAWATAGGKEERKTIFFKILNFICKNVDSNLFKCVNGLLKIFNIVSFYKMFNLLLLDVELTFKNC